MDRKQAELFVAFPGEEAKARDFVRVDKEGGFLVRKNQGYRHFLNHTFPPPYLGREDNQQGDKKTGPNPAKNHTGHYYYQTPHSFDNTLECFPLMPEKGAR